MRWEYYIEHDEKASGGLQIFMMCYRLNFLKTILLEERCFKTCQLLLCSKVNQVHVSMCPHFLGSSPHPGHHRALRVPCAYTRFSLMKVA